MKKTVKIPDGDGGLVEFEIEKLPRDEWSALVAAHPPRANRDDLLWNETTFPVALIARSWGVTKSEASQWWEKAADDQANTMYEECLRLSSPGSVDWAIHRLKANPRLQAEVRTAMRAGISHDAFLKWPDDSQDLAIALSAVEADRCPGGCGVSRAEMQDPTAYTPVVSSCMWCQQLEIKRSEINSQERGHRHVSLISKG